MGARSALRVANALQSIQLGLPGNEGVKALSMVARFHILRKETFTDRQGGVSLPCRSAPLRPVCQSFLTSTGLPPWAADSSMA